MALTETAHLPQMPAGIRTLDAAKRWLREQAWQGGALCPTCQRFTKIEGRALDAVSALVVALMFRHRVQAGGTDGEGWIHLPSYFVSLGFAPLVAALVAAEYDTLELYGLIERKPGVRHDGEAVGHTYGLTALGSEFAQERCRVRASIYVYNGRELKKKGVESVSVREALGDALAPEGLLRDRPATRLDRPQLIAATKAIKAKHTNLWAGGGVAATAARLDVCDTETDRRESS